MGKEDFGGWDARAVGMKRSLLVVGGAGYIGSHMLVALRDAGFAPVVFDNLSRGHRDAIGDSPLFWGDLRRLSDIETCLQQNKFDVIFHFAALAYVGESVTDPESYYQNNVLGTLNLLTAMRKHGANRLVFSSTCATYGEPKAIPITEDHPQSPINPYGRSKLMIETILRDYGVAYGLRSVSLRYFNAAGCDPLGRLGERHEPETHLIPLVLNECLRVRNGGDPEQTQLQVFGTDFDTKDGSCIRDYIHVADLCQAHLLAAERLMAESPSILDSEGAEFYNLSNARGVSVLNIIAECERITKVEVKYKIMPRRAGDPSILVGSSELASATLGWHPKYQELQKIIETAWEWLVKVESRGG